MQDGISRPNLGLHIPITLFLSGCEKEQKHKNEAALQLLMWLEGAEYGIRA